jgi:hypothetical protein
MINFANNNEMSYVAPKHQKTGRGHGATRGEIKGTPSRFFELANTPAQ